jgi:inhibitor of cysteine peptidase
MVYRIPLTIIAIVLIMSLAGCGAKTTTPAATDLPEASVQPTTPATPAEEYPAGNEIMLPMISGKVANVTLDAMADGTTQQLKVGEVMAVALESNPSTGYAWYATISDTKVLVQMGEPQYNEPSAGAVVGAAGTQTFFFQAIEPGTSLLTLEYKRGWETDVTPEKTVSINVEVK